MTSMDHHGRSRNCIPNEAKRGCGGNDPLPRLLSQLVERAGSPSAIERAVSRPWASALFQGRRHLIRLRLSGADATGRLMRFAAGLEEAEWTLPRHFVADICIDAKGSDGDGEWLELSALTIEDW